MLVTENGIATEDDAERISYMAEALEGVLRCIEDGVDVRAYFAWSSARQLRVDLRVRAQVRAV